MTIEDNLRKMFETVNAKEGLKPGQWMEEPDYLVFEAHGFTCAIVRRSGTGHLCGYVVLDHDHPWVREQDPYVNVHGGLTCLKEMYWSDGKTVAGFDCAHSGDVLPSMSNGGWLSSPYGESYKDITYVQRHTTCLAQQARDAVPALFSIESSDIAVVKEITQRIVNTTQTDEDNTAHINTLRGVTNRVTEVTGGRTAENMVLRQTLGMLECAIEGLDADEAVDAPHSVVEYLQTFLDEIMS
jgi:hypothetical protein